MLPRKLHTRLAEKQVSQEENQNHVSTKFQRRQWAVTSRQTVRPHQAPGSTSEVRQVEGPEQAASRPLVASWATSSPEFQELPVPTLHVPHCREAWHLDISDQCAFLGESHPITIPTPYTTSPQQCMPSPLSLSLSSWVQGLKVKKRSTNLLTERSKFQAFQCYMLLTNLRPSTKRSTTKIEKKRPYLLYLTCLQPTT